MQWTRVVLKQGGHGVDHFLTLSGAVNGTLTSPLLIEAKSVAFSLLMSRSALKVEAFRSGTWLPVLSTAESGAEWARWRAFSAALPVGSTYVRFLGYQYDNGHVNIDSVTVSQKSANQTHQCTCPHGTPRSGQDCIPICKDSPPAPAAPGARALLMVTESIAMSPV
eukprot:COSAG01_NODE_35862_length_525_cov_2.002347_1_plen_165_part_10